VKLGRGKCRFWRNITLKQPTSGPWGLCFICEFEGPEKISEDKKVGKKKRLQLDCRASRRKKLQKPCNFIQQNAMAKMPLICAKTTHLRGCDRLAHVSHS
jgi:hypothetical protein